MTEATRPKKAQDTMELWNAVRQPPKDALKQIKGGRLKGFTDISPMWRIMALTEQFGLCGFGWKYTVDELWTTPGTDTQVFAHARISLFIMLDGKWSDAIPGVGGDKLVAKEAGGLYNNDEAFKMAITDALGAACKALGFGADIYLGRWDGSKYNIPDKDTSSIEEWLATCEKGSITSAEKFKGWWPKHSEQIKKECGEAGAAQVYSAFSEYYKRLKQEAANASA